MERGTVMNDSVVAILLTFNRRHLVTRALDSLLAQSRPIDKIVLVDNASTDGTAEMLKAQGYLDNGVVDLVSLPINLGCSGGLHAGIERAMSLGYDWLWLMDDDATAESNALEVLLDHPDTRRLGIATCAVLIEDGTPNQRAVTSIYSNDRLFMNVTHPSSQDVGPIVYSTPLLGFIVSSEKVRARGNIRADYYIQAEDLEWTLRLAGKDGIAYVRSAHIMHLDDVVYEEKDIKGRKIYYLARSSLWKDYYGVRNLIITMRLRNVPKWRSIATKRFIRLLIDRLLVGKAFPLALHLYTLAYIHGMFGRSGKVIPDGYGVR